MATKKNTNPSSAKQPTPPPIATKPAIPDVFSMLGNKAPLVVFGILLLAVFLVFKDFLLSDKVYLFKDIGSDSLNALYPYMNTLTAFVHSHTLPTWSYNVGMGQNVLPYVFRDPFDIIFYFTGQNNIVGGIVYKEIAKILLGGLIFFYYLRKLNLSVYTSIVGSLFYGFCSYIVVGSGWHVHSLEVFEMAFLLLGFEHLFSNDKWWLLPIPFFLIAISQPFNLYIYGFFLALYAVLRLIQTDQLTVKNTIALFSKMAGLGALALLLSAPILLENILMIMESPRGSGSYSYAHILKQAPMFGTPTSVDMGTDIMRFFSTDILGSGSNFRGTGNILEAPLFYCGLPCLILMPQVFQFFHKTARIAFIVFISLWLLPVIFPYFRYAFFLFSGDYFRAYSFLVSFVFMFYTLLALDFILKERKVNLIVLIVTVVLLLVLLNYPYFPDKEIINTAIATFAGFMLLVYGVLVFLMGRLKDITYIKYIFLAAIFFELVYFSRTSVNDRDLVSTSELAERVNFNDYTKEAVAYVKQHDKSFYRIDKTYASSGAIHYSLNDAMVQDYYGTSSYSSFNQGNYVNYLASMGLINKNSELESRWASGLSSRPILESVDQVKYILAKKNVNPIWRITCDSIATFGDVKVFRNKFELPFGFTYGSYIKLSAFDNLSPVQKDFISLQACVINDADISKVVGLKEFQLKDTIPAFAFNGDVFQSNISNLKKDTVNLSKFEQTGFAGKIDVSEDKLVYLSIPFDAGWKLKVDGQPQDKIMTFSGMTGVMLKKGTHTVEMTYGLRYFKTGMYLFVLGLLLYGGIWGFVRMRKEKSETAPAL